MAGTEQISTIGTQILEKVLSSGIIIFGVILLCGFIFAIAFYIRYLRQFNVKVEVLSLRGRGVKGEPIYKIINDIGGVIENRKTKARYFRLRSHRIDLPSPPNEVMQLDSKGVNHIKILQKSDTEFYYMLPDKVDTSVIVRNGVEIPIAQMNIKVVDGAIAFWGQIRKRNDEKLFDPEGLAMKLIPYIGLIILFMGIIFISYFITQHWGEFAAAAEALKGAAEALRSTTTASVTTG